VITAERLIKALERSIEIGDVQVSAQTSIGIAVFPDHGLSAAALIKCADAAMYRAKRRGPNAYALAHGAGAADRGTRRTGDHGVEHDDAGATERMPTLAAKDSAGGRERR